MAGTAVGEQHHPTLRKVIRVQQALFDQMTLFERTHRYWGVNSCVVGFELTNKTIRKEPLVLVSEIR